MIKKIVSFFSKIDKKQFTDFDETKRNKISNKIFNLLGSYPTSINYYIKAFTHRSFLEKAEIKIKSNERLEFLGDSILGKVTAEYLFNNFQDKNEGFLTKARSQIVNKDSLEKIGYDLELEKLLFLNEKYLSLDKMKLGNIVADSLEALIAAIYLDKGEKIIQEFIVNFIIKPQIGNGGINRDTNFKGQLLEFSHANNLDQPIYEIIEQTGPQHEKMYKIKVTIGANISGIGRGPSKKSAEQEAAQKALKEAKSRIK